MVDAPLPLDGRPRPLRYLFLDLNAYFASVEQQVRPELRGRPVAVVPVEADTSSVIAASYEAKRAGVKGLMRVGEARRVCPELHVVKGRWPLYTHYHDLVVEAVERVLPVEAVCSIDEMRIRLLGEECRPERARELALQVKASIHEHAGEALHCSVGIAPNPFLAKLGTELEKPNGLVVLEQHDLPHRLHALSLTDFTGINRRTAARLNAAGIYTAEHLCGASRDELRLAFGSITGERWWYLLRGYDVDVPRESGKSLGHSHVLPPEMRNERGCREVLLRLLQKASARLRAEGLWTGAMTVFVDGRESWHARVKLPPTQDTMTLNDYFLEAWERRSFAGPLTVGVTFHDLRKPEAVTPSLFEDTRDRAALSRAADALNQRFGKNTVFLAGVGGAKDAADEKIAFQKTRLFREGAGDNEWTIESPPPESGSEGGDEGV